MLVEPSGTRKIRCAEPPAIERGAEPLGAIGACDGIELPELPQPATTVTANAQTAARIKCIVFHFVLSDDGYATRRARANFLNSNTTDEANRQYVARVL